MQFGRGGGLSVAFQAPGSAFRTIFDDDPGGREGVANGVGRGPVLVGPGCGAGLELGFHKDRERSVLAPLNSFRLLY